MCPECQGKLQFSFITVEGESVYQCGWAGVPVYAPNKHGHLVLLGHSLNHQDRFFVQDEAGRWTRVVPTAIDAKHHMWAVVAHNKEQAA